MYIKILEKLQLDIDKYLYLKKLRVHRKIYNKKILEISVSDGRWIKEHGYTAANAFEMVGEVEICIDKDKKI